VLACTIMDKEKLYNIAGKWINNKFDTLVKEQDNEPSCITLCSCLNNKTIIRIYKSDGCVCYNVDYMKKIIKLFPMQIEDFELLLKKWVQYKFDIKVTEVIAFDLLIVNPQVSYMIYAQR